MNVKRLNGILEILFDQMNGSRNEEKEIPVLWHVAHLYSSLQIAKILAMKRGLNIELSAIIAAFHDIAVIRTKKAKDHSENAEKYIREIIQEYNNNINNTRLQVTEEELDIIINAAIKHTQKEILSNELYVELLKDVDSLDMYLHGIEINEDCILRSNKAIEELGISLDKLKYV